MKLPLWGLIVISFAGILFIGALYDFIIKKKNKRISVESRNQNPFDEIVDPISKDGPPL